MNAEKGERSPPRSVMATVCLLVVSLAMVAAAAMRPQAPATAKESVSDPVSYTECQKRFATLTNEELAELIARENRFQSLPESRQRYLRSLHEQWLEHPDRDQLLNAMQGYTRWLMTLTAEERVLVKSGDIRQRMEAIAEMRQRKAEEIFGFAGETKLPGKDVSTLFEWSKEFVENRQDEIRRLLFASEGVANPSGGDRERGRSRSGERVFFEARRRRPEAVVELIRESDIESLKLKLSPEAVAIIDDQGDLPSRQKLVFRWVNAAFDSLYNPEVSERDLREYFETELTSEQRKEIEALAPEQRVWRLRLMYNRRNLRNIAPNLFPPPGEGFRPPPVEKNQSPPVPDVDPDKR